MTGPYQTPLALGRDPLMAFFWVILAPVLFIYGAYEVTLSVTPEFTPGTSEEIDAYQLLWRLHCVAIALWFGLMSLWSNWVGAGPFAGEMRTTSSWLIAAGFLGPLIFVIPGLLIGSLMPDEQWQYRTEIDTSIFAPQNWTLAYIFAHVLIAPIVEEVAFRGVGMGALIARGLSPIGAVVLTSAAFAFMHIQYSIPAMIIVFFAGVGFAALRLITGTVAIPIVAHIAANTFVFYLNWAAANPAG